jgi:hypothetical protein
MTEPTSCRLQSRVRAEAEDLEEEKDEEET